MDLAWERLSLWIRSRETLARDRDRRERGARLREHPGLAPETATGRAAEQLSDLLRFARSAAILTAPECRALKRWAGAHPRAAARALAEAAGVREAIAAIFQAIVRGKTIPAAPLARLESACHAASGARALRAGDRGAAWSWREASAEPDRPAWAAALDAARILTSGESGPGAPMRRRPVRLVLPRHLTQPHATLVQLKGCGNRNKARRFYERSAARGT